MHQDADHRGVSPEHRSGPPANDVRFSPEDIEALIAKVDGVTSAFSADERALLQALLALAGEAIAVRSEGDVQGFNATGPQWTGLLPGLVLYNSGTLSLSGSPVPGPSHVAGPPPLNISVGPATIVRIEP